MHNQRIATQLDTLFSTLAINICILLCASNIFALLLNILKRYALPTFEKAQYPIASLLIARFLCAAAYIVLFVITLKCKRRLITFFLYTLLPIMSFEFALLSLNYSEAYIAFLLINSSFREIVLLGSNYKVYYISEGINIAYHLARAFILNATNKDYSIFKFFIYFFVYICATLPILETHSKIRIIINECDQLKNDFSNVISSLPTPVIKFSTKPFEIVLKNKEFENFIENNGITCSGFINLLLSDEILHNQIEKATQYSNSTLIVNQKEYNFRSRKLEQSEGQFYIACIEDLNIVKEIEKLKAMQAYKRMFISVINHQLRTPLNGVYSPLCMIKEKPERSDRIELLDLAIGSLDILNSLIDDTIAFSECEEGKLKVMIQETHIISEIIKLKKVFAFESKQKQVSFNLEINVKHHIISTDTKKLMQILIILISNAFKYTFKGSVDLKCIENDGVITFTVADSGIGIKAERLPSIFTEFSSVEAINKEHLTSTGFQLSLVKKLIDLLKGTIDVSSEYGKGTTFSVQFNVGWANEIKKSGTNGIIEENVVVSKIPITRSYNIIKTAYPGSVSNIKDKFSNQADQKSVLVVDDNMTNIYVLQKMLSTLGLQCDKAMNGLECVEKMRASPLSYCLILMDINMPVMNGLDASREIMKLSIEANTELCPIVAVTAQDECGIEEQCFTAGILKCIFKPVKISVLKDLMLQYKLISI